MCYEVKQRLQSRSSCDNPQSPVLAERVEIEDEGSEWVYLDETLIESVPDSVSHLVLFTIEVVQTGRKLLNAVW